MCGRLNISDHAGIRWLCNEMGIPLFDEEMAPHSYNVPPGQSMPVLNTQRGLAADYMWWGIEYDFDTGKKMFPNAKAETLAKRKRLPQRCILPVNGFYEWRKGDKQAFHFTATDSPALALAAICQFTNQRYQFSIVTTTPNNTMSSIHHRMPVILPHNAAKDYLLSDDRGYVESLWKPCSDDFIQYQSVSSFVNNTRNDGPSCIEPTIN